MSKIPCFVISPIGSEDSDIRKRADLILKHIITPVVEKCGFDPIRADKISEPGMITSQVIQHIVDDPLVIADLTGMNANVFYELALRHAIRKPFVQIIQKGDQIPFDVADMRTIPVDHKDLDSVGEAKEEIEKQILAIKDKKPEDIDTPISFSLDLQSLKASGNIEQRSIGEIISIVNDFRHDLNSINNKLDSSANLINSKVIRTIVKEARREGVQEYELQLEALSNRLRKVVALKKGDGSMGELELELDSIDSTLARLSNNNNNNTII